MRIGVISDTHGRLRPEVFGQFEDADLIVHAGDIGDITILADLEAIAPVAAVWGNTDDFSIRRAVPESVTLEVEGRTLLLVHGHQLGSPSPRLLADAYPDADIIVFGHTHRPLVERLDDRLYINPGGAGPPRFGLRPSIMLLDVDAAADDVTLIEL